MKGRIKHRQAGISVNYTTREERSGTHNRKARRAARAQKAQPALFAEPTIEEQIWKLLVAHQKRERAKREANPPALDQQRYDEEHGYLDPWPEWIPMAECLEAALESAPGYAQLDAAAFSAEGVRLADIIAFDGGEHLTCDTGKLSKKEQAQKADAVKAFGQSLGLGSCVPGGIKFSGIWLETIDGHTHARISVPKESA